MFTRTYPQHHDIMAKNSSQSFSPRLMSCFTNQHDCTFLILSQPTHKLFIAIYCTCTCISGTQKCLCLFPVVDSEQLPVTGAAAAVAMAAISHPQTVSSDSRKGKSRTSINPRQLEILQAAYERDPKPSRALREEMAAQTGLTMKVIQVWFQNRRSKDKKEGVLKEEPLSAASPAATPGQPLSLSMAAPSSLPENGVAMLQQTIQSEQCTSTGYIHAYLL